MKEELKLYLDVFEKTVYSSVFINDKILESTYEDEVVRLFSVENWEDIEIKGLLRNMDSHCLLPVSWKMFVLPAYIYYGVFYNKPELISASLDILYWVAVEGGEYKKSGGDIKQQCLFVDSFLSYIALHEQEILLLSDWCVIDSFWTNKEK